MKQTINLSQFRDAFHSMDRGNQFSYEGLEILFDWIERMDDDTGQETELDVVGLCCEFEELNYLDIANQYEIDLIDCEDEEEQINAVIDYIQEKSQFCGITSENDIIYMQF
jgi:hypothetical protein